MGCWCLRKEYWYLVHLLNASPTDDLPYCANVRISKPLWYKRFFLQADFSYVYMMLEQSWGVSMDTASLTLYPQLIMLRVRLHINFYLGLIQVVIVCLFSYFEDIICLLWACMSKFIAATSQLM